MSTDVCTNVFYSDTASPVITTDDIKPELTVNVPFSLPYVHATTVAMMASGERKRKQEDDAVEGASSSSSESSESSSSHKKRKRKHQHSREGKSRKNSKRSLHSRDEPGPRSTDAKPRSKQTSVQQLSDRHFVVRVHALPADGEANEAIQIALADFFKISRSSVRLLKGHKGKRKIFEIDG